jgi:O-antigen ligase
MHYLFVFPQDDLAYTAFTHNITLQVLLDEGYLGLLILVAVLVRTFVLLKRHLRREPGSPAVALVAMLLVFVVSGATEVSPTYYTEEVLIMVFLIAGAAAALAGAPRPDEDPVGSSVAPLGVRVYRPVPRAPVHALKAASPP